MKLFSIESIIDLLPQLNEKQAYEQNKKLKAARGLLLPRLMSGEIAV
jgi:hypothetical protein